MKTEEKEPGGVWVSFDDIFSAVTCRVRGRGLESVRGMETSRRQARSAYVCGQERECA